MLRIDGPHVAQDSSFETKAAAAGSGVVSFSCVGCGRCCHDLRLPLSIAEAIRWVRAGGDVQLLLSASPAIGSVDSPMYTCLGHDDQRDLKVALREGGIAGLDAAIADALSTKPRRHDFRIGAGAAPAVTRHMSVTRG